MHGKKVSIDLAEVDAEQAMKIINEENFHGQRPIRRHHVNFLAQTMRQGRFVPGTSIHFACYQHRRYLINGQHTLSAIVEANVIVPLTIHEIQVETEADIGALYGRHDRGLQRSLMDSYNAVGFAQRAGLSKGRVEALGGCLPLVMAGFESDGTNYHGPAGVFMRDPDIRVVAMQDWLEEAQAFFADISQIPAYIQRALCRQSVLSVVLVTYRYTGSDAVEFWREVMAVQGNNDTAPATRLFHFLQNNPAKRYMPRLYARYVATCWNSWFEEKSLQRVYARDLMLPILIAGTPFEGEKRLTYFSPDGWPLHEPRIIEESMHADS